MKNRNRIIRVLLCSLMGMSITLTFAQDWPQWRGLNRDGKVSGFEAPDVWPEKLTRIWSMPVGLGDASPALVGDRLYLFVQQEAEEVTLCLDANTGKVIWECKGAGDKPGYASPILIEYKGLRQIVTAMSESIVGVRASDGKLLWRYPHKVYYDENIATPIFQDGFLIVTGCAAIYPVDRIILDGRIVATGIQKYSIHGVTKYPATPDQGIGTCVLQPDAAIAGGKVEIPIALNIPKLRVFCVLGKDARGGCYTARNSGLTARYKLGIGFPREHAILDDGHNRLALCSRLRGFLLHSFGHFGAPQDRVTRNALCRSFKILIVCLKNLSTLNTSVEMFSEQSCQQQLFMVDRVLIEHETN